MSGEAKGLELSSELTLGIICGIIRYKIRVLFYLHESTFHLSLHIVSVLVERISSRSFQECDGDRWTIVPVFVIKPINDWVLLEEAMQVT